MKRNFALLIIFAVSCTTTTPPATGPALTGWKQWESGADAGFDPEALDAARVFADESHSAAVVIVHGGNVLAAWGDIDRKLELHSIRKSLYVALWGIAVESGLADLGVTVGELGIDDLQPLTTEEKRARLVDLFQARSGVYHPAAYSADDAAVRPARGSHQPGTHWYYNNWDFNVAGTLLERLSGRPLGELFDDWIARPVGMEDFQASDVFEVLEPGQSRFPALTFRMSARDLARVGQLWLDQGRWAGQQVIPARWVERASTPASETAPGQGYAMMWWTYDAGSLPAERYPNANQYDIIQARGTGGQSVFVVPAAELVLVHRGDTDHGRRVSGRDVWALLDRVLAAKRQRASKPVRLVPMQAIPFASQLPELEWPEAIELPIEEMQLLAGDYEFGHGKIGKIFLHQGRLFAFIPGEGEAELFARSRDEFFLRVDPAVSVRFRRDSGKDVRAVEVLMPGRKLIGTRRSEP